jgi:cyclopropane-fatty-acyl-phospholipid synthase
MSTPAFTQEVRYAPEPVRVSRSRPFSALERFARTQLCRRLEGLRWGRLVLRDALGSQVFGGAEGPSATIEVHDGELYLDIAKQGSVGAGEAYAHGAWSTDDLTHVIRILVRNRDVLQGMEKGFARLGSSALRIWHSRRDNTRAGSRENIAAHYDLGNEFYELWLDETMMYSCAAFERADMTLHEAQVARLDRICRKLDLKPTDHLLEIGTGWGGMALHAAREFGCRVTTTTISRRQHEKAVERVRAAGLEDRVTVLFEDYRDLQGRFDKLVSLEMIEAVGERWYDTYFTKCSDLLAPNGLMLLQAITIRDSLYEEALRSVDFIQRFIFPGSCIPSTAAIMDRVARVTDMNLFHLEDIGPHYAPTLRMWRENMARNAEQIRALGYSEEFLRMWEFYLCYCEGGFEERSIQDVQMLLAKPENRRNPLLPTLR